MDKERMLKEYDSSRQEYENNKYRYESMSPVAKLVNRITGKKPKPPVPLRFAIRYDRIGLPFRHTEEKIVSKDYSVFVDSVDPIPDKDIDNLWTVVEYDGDGLFTDLVTGCKFRLAHDEKKMHDMFNGFHSYVTDEYKDIVGKYGKLVDHPLAIASPDMLLDLSASKKKFILDMTLPRAEEVKKKMGEKEITARKAVVEKYQSEFFDYRDEYDTHSAERKEREERKAEADRQWNELQQELAAEREAIMKDYEKMAEEVNPMFDEAFPKSVKH